MVKKSICFFLVVVVFIFLVSCGRRYPDYLTGEYINEHYELIDMNLVYLMSYDKCIDSIADYGRMCHFIEIKDISLEQYIGMTSSYALWDKGENAYVLFNSDSFVNPINDSTVEKIELYAKSDYFSSHKLGIEKYGQIIYAQGLYTVDDLELTREISESIRNADRKNIKDIKELQCESGRITLRIHFKEYENIVWDAEIGEKEGKYYLYILLVDEERGIFSLDGNYVYAYVGPQFDAMMESLLADL